MEKIQIYTDGACSGNPGPGGWAAVIIYGKNLKTISGGERETTNNRMELTSVIKSLDTLKESYEIELYSDSKYVIKGITQWIHNWKRKDWRGYNKKPVKNKDLWQKLDTLSKKHRIKWLWVEGHIGKEINEQVDKMAKYEIKKIKEIIKMERAENGK
ncbi:MAG: ribonuclease HI [Candidatus Cloacimonadota bacterium]|nr:MAG: ribonuclease HI [Candidatus Cloacimonadota bacterium]